MVLNAKPTRVIFLVNPSSFRSVASAKAPSSTLSYILHNIYSTCIEAKELYRQE